VDRREPQRRRTEALAASQQNVPKHVDVLAQAGIVAGEKHSSRVRCSIADQSIFERCELVCGELRRQVAELDRYASMRPMRSSVASSLR
jgi:DNA-binding transcriptional ArsR family regulator